MFIGKMYSRKEAKFNLRDMESHPDTEATITVRLLTPGERQKVMDASFETVFVQDDAGQMNPETRAGGRKSLEQLFHLAVVGWDGVYADAEGKTPLKFGAAGRKTFLEFVPEIADFVGSCHRKLVEEEQAAREDERKNS